MNESVMTELIPTVSIVPFLRPHLLEHTHTKKQEGRRKVLGSQRQVGGSRKKVSG